MLVIISGQKHIQRFSHKLLKRSTQWAPVAQDHPFHSRHFIKILADIFQYLNVVFKKLLVDFSLSEKVQLG